MTPTENAAEAFRSYTGLTPTVEPEEQELAPFALEGEEDDAADEKPAAKKTASKKKD